MGKPTSPYWNTHSASKTLERIIGYEEDKSYRPTVVVPIVDYAGRPLLVRHATPEGNWGLVQGHIETFDADPVAACRREAFEEAWITDEKVDRVYPFLLEESVDAPSSRNHETGYRKGGYYVCVGLKLKPGADISTEPPKGLSVALLERRWCSSLDQAVRVLREQPGVIGANRATLEKAERVLIPALESMYQPYVEEYAEILNDYYI